MKVKLERYKSTVNRLILKAQESNKMEFRQESS